MLRAQPDDVMARDSPKRRQQQQTWHAGVPCTNGPMICMCLFIVQFIRLPPGASGAELCSLCDALPLLGKNMALSHHSNPP
ncbi:hypothetical protein K458DRAFT_164779 [Lentithecium fluviatile CBS 122367]|uniref:Uncharacterized protein n=1 Tax=Lentithecium fluviatile CBS 122367 TaxID=1168545 RepID=A0A6G1IFW4_9PLEO|nr:hypothetical protein K458DRAFT_164779 [Lentithecium fluviatile CBS 122367]